MIKDKIKVVIEEELEAYGYKAKTDYVRLQSAKYTKVWNEELITRK